jgi:hypothetical protein
MQILLPQPHYVGIAIGIAIAIGIDPVFGFC